MGAQGAHGVREEGCAAGAARGRVRAAAPAPAVWCCELLLCAGFVEKVLQVACRCCLFVCVDLCSCGETRSANLPRVLLLLLEVVLS